MSLCTAQADRIESDGSMVAPPRMTYSSHGVPAAMRDVYCNAVNTSSQRYTPLHFTDRMGGAVAGRPIAIRFVETGPSTVRIVRSKK